MTTNAPGRSRVARGDERRPATSWLDALRRYVLFVVIANLLWEFAHMPLYTLWETGTAAEIVFAAVHCTGGDALIALSAIMLALFLSGARAWPARGARPVAALTLVFGLAYTVFSEWLNVEVRGTWAYGDLMPLVPPLGTGLSPILQWIVIPLAGFGWALRGRSESFGEARGRF